MKLKMTGLTTTEIRIPSSAATKNLILCALFSGVALVLSLFNVPLWTVILAGGIAGGFLFSAVACVLDVQEFKMKQLQEIINLLTRMH